MSSAREQDPNVIGTNAHHELQMLRIRLLKIHDSMANYQPLTPKPPILDSSVELARDRQWLRQEYIPGLKSLMEAVRRDLDVLQKFLADPNCASLPALSTNAPYLIAVWNELLCGPPPIVSIFKSVTPNGLSIGWKRQHVTHKPLGIKIDVVADNGKRWIRVNTVKNDRMLAEFREIDSYLTDSDDDSDGLSNDGPPSLAQSEFDNSVLRLGRSLVQAAEANPLPGTTKIPQVTMRLTRLDPSQSDVKGNDPRIARTVQCLTDMGIDVQLGERGHIDPPAHSPPSSTPLELSTRINLDLSVLIALVSDLTHAPLPTSPEQANTLFIPSQKYREWKQQRLSTYKEKRKEGDPAVEAGSGEISGDIGQHSRALSNQVLQEIGKGMLQELSDRLSSLPRVEFWTTPDARDRCLRIVSKIGGLNEQRRASALFHRKTSVISNIEEEYWRDSRYPRGHLSFLPIYIHPSSEPGGQHPSAHNPPQPSFFRLLAQTCREILAQETMPHPRSLPNNSVGRDGVRESSICSDEEIRRAAVTRAGPRLTVHTVQSMLWGAELGWTTLTANKTSVKAILREMKAARGRWDDVLSRSPDIEVCGRGRGETAAIWVIDPRSLAEGMRSDAESS